MTYGNLGDIAMRLTNLTALCGEDKTHIDEGEWESGVLPMM